MSRRSDFPIAALGFFGGAIVLALILAGISRLTTQKYEKRAAAEQTR